LLTGVRKGLAELGYVEGQNFRFELRDTNEIRDRIPIMFREFGLPMLWSGGKSV
jgi:hypothetical protein